MTEDAKQAFLEKITEGWSLKRAAKHAGYDRRTFFQLRTTDPEFLLRIGKEILRPYWGSCRYLRAKRGHQGTKAAPHAAGESIGEVT